MTQTQPTISHVTPRLILADVDAALDYYTAVFGAERNGRFVDAQGVVVHASMRIADTEISMAQEMASWQLLSPASLGGSAVLLSVTLEDPDAVAARAVERGGQMIIPLKDRPYGKREGRLRDPFGHLWVLTKDLEALGADEIRARLSGQRG